MKEYRNVDKSNWPQGPWQDEPDKAQWVDEETGLDCLIVRNGAGALCGYVGVPPGHPWHGTKYHDDGPEACEVHGGLTYSDKCQESAPEGHGICHVPEPGRPDDVWWFGFDCAHGFDLAPAPSRSDIGMLGDCFRMLSDTIDGLTGGDQQYRTVDYVRDQCASLAKQLRAAA